MVVVNCHFNPRKSRVKITAVIYLSTFITLAPGGQWYWVFPLSKVSLHLPQVQLASGTPTASATGPAGRSWAAPPSWTTCSTSGATGKTTTCGRPTGTRAGATTKSCTTSRSLRTTGTPTWCQCHKTFSSSSSPKISWSVSDKFIFWLSDILPMRSPWWCMPLPIPTNIRLS